MSLWNQTVHHKAKPHRLKTLVSHESKNMRFISVHLKKTESSKNKTPHHLRIVYTCQHPLHILNLHKYRDINNSTKQKCFTNEFCYTIF